MPLLHEDRLFPGDPSARAIAKTIYESVRDLPILSPHGHTQAAWLGEDEAFAIARDLSYEIVRRAYKF